MSGCSGSPSSRRRRVRPGVVVLSPVVALATLVGAAGQPAGAAPCWLPPVVGTIADPYREPPCRWCAGNRGLEYRIGRDVAVRSAASGRVVYVGTVVDVRYVVIRIAGGRRHTYGQLTSTPLELGDVVLTGATVGRASNTFFFGLRVGEEYADPAPFLGHEYIRPRLVPIDGTTARPAPPAQLRCPNSAGGRASYGSRHA